MKSVLVLCLTGALVGSAASYPMIYPDPEATISSYPKYPGRGPEYETIGGKVFLKENDTHLGVEWTLTGLPANSTGGIHVHSGDSCFAHDLVGGHYFSPPNDPWNTMWESDSHGDAHQIVTLAKSDGAIGLDMSLGHAVVVHNTAKARIGCGTLHVPLAAIAEISKIPGYEGNHSVEGYIAIESGKPSSELSATTHMNGLTPNVVEGPWHVHVGGSCEAPGAHYFGSEQDPWIGRGTGYGYNTNAEGKSMDIDLELMNDDANNKTYYSFAESIDKTVVVHDNTPPFPKIGCGILKYPEYACAKMAPFPGYNGNFTVEGSVMFLDARPEDVLLMVLSVSGLEINEMGGVHIHANKTCDPPGGHYYTGDTDHWIPIKWQSDHQGSSSTEILLQKDKGFYSFEESKGHAVVIHGSNGEKIACGVFTIGDCPANPTPSPVITPSTTESPTKAPKEDDDDLSGGEVAGIVIGCLAGVGLIGGAVMYNSGGAAGASAGGGGADSSTPPVQEQQKAQAPAEVGEKALPAPTGSTPAGVEMTTV